MFRYVKKRLLFMIPVVIGVAVLIFTIMYFTPGDPAMVILGSNATVEEVESLREVLGLNGGYFVRLFRFLKSTFIEFDLGKSWTTLSPITGEIASRFPRTVLLAVISVCASALIGIPLGVTAAVHQDGIIDRICMVVATVFSCIPNFWFALMCVLLFSLKLGWLPAYGIGGPEYYVIPCIAILTHSFAGLSRQTRSAMLEVIRSDYVVTARAQGFPERDVIYKYALPNAMIPVITLLGSSFARGLGGTLIIETVFSMPGLGLYIRDAIAARDYPIVQGSVVFLAIMFSFIMLLVDLLYASVDPRIKAQYVDMGKRRTKK